MRNDNSVHNNEIQVQEDESMQKISLDKSKRIALTNPNLIDISRGEVLRQPMTDGVIDIRVGMTDFENGGTCVFHTHDTDQIVIITEGEGICATETEELVVKAGDLVIFPAGEKHLHGAKPNGSMSHYGITYQPTQQ
jgi:quercetin dioxygenase-like cupin family protein